MLTIIVFILILGVLIFVHELGHFLTARRNGIRASEFGFGFPPRIVGFQFMSGKKHEEKLEVESIQMEKTDIKLSDNEEIIKETITEKIHRVPEIVPVKKWRLIWGSKDGDDENEKADLAEARENQETGGTIYSLNWIPVGGFVKIKGENGDAKEDPDSFAGKPAWTRIKVLIAGVIMNFVLAWFLIAISLMIGVPKEFANIIDKNSEIKISQVSPNSPAEKAGLKSGDEVVTNQGEINLKSESEFIGYVNSKKGQEISLKIKIKS